MPSTDHEDYERRDALPAGTVLRDFTIQAVIGHGGFGIVYRAGHNELDLTVAIKEYLPVELAVREGATVQPRCGTDRKHFEDGLRRFRDEAQALIDFGSHPSIVSCREFFRAHGTAYLVMDNEDGRSLAEVLATREADGLPFTESDLLAVMTPLLEGLARVHAAGVLHRDIKPSNILIRRRDGRPVLIDFGAAKQAAAKYSKSQAPYTEGYAALEQVADSGKLGPWTDMYGVGAVMWRMVAGGNRPWEPPHPVRVELRSHALIGTADDPMPSACELGKTKFPLPLLEAIDRCLRLRETERVQDSRELLQVLDAARSQPPAAVSIEIADPSLERAVGARKESGSRPVPPVPESRSGWRTLGWLVLAILAFGLGLTMATWWGPGFEQTTQDPRSLGIPGPPGGEAAATERPEPFDSAASPSRRPENRESPPQSKKPVQAPDPTGSRSGRKEKPSLRRFERDDDRLKVRQERSQGGIEQPGSEGRLGDERSAEAPGPLGTEEPIAGQGESPEQLARSSRRPANREAPPEANRVAESPPPPVLKKKAPPQRIRVGGNVAKARLVRQVRPQYPPLARQARIQGTVKLSAVISKDGSIQRLEVLSGHPLLVPSAMAAVKQWRYRPTLFNGVAVEVLTNIDVNFTLSG